MFYEKNLFFFFKQNITVTNKNIIYDPKRASLEKRNISNVPTINISPITYQFAEFQASQTYFLNVSQKQTLLPPPLTKFQVQVVRFVRSTKKKKKKC
jgi:hypothetical protein